MLNDVEKRGHCAEIEGAGAEPDAVAGDTGEFGKDDSEVLAALGDFASDEFFDGERVGKVVAVSVEVIHAVGHDDAFVIGLVFGFFFHSGVEVADDAFCSDDDFAFEFANDSEDAVGGWVLWSHVDDHRVLAGLFEDGFG